MIYNKKKFKKLMSYYLRKDLIWNYEAWLEDAELKVREHGEGSHCFEISSRHSNSGTTECVWFDAKWSKSAHCWHLYF